MDGSKRSAHITRLRETITQFENRPVLAGTALDRMSGADPVSGLAGGVLHEVWADHFSHGGAAAGFMLGAGQRFLSAARPAILWLCLASEMREEGVPYAPGFARFGLDPSRLLIGRMQKIEDLLWAIEEAIACPAIAAVCVEINRHHKALDFTATRRIGLRTMATGAPVFLLRFGQGREASAASYRWHVAPAPSMEKGFDARAPGAPRWQIRLEKGQGLHGIENRRGEWVLRWTENGFADDADTAKHGHNERTGQTISGAVPAALGDRLSQTA